MDSYLIRCYHGRTKTVCSRFPNYSASCLKKFLEDIAGAIFEKIHGTNSEKIAADFYLKFSNIYEVYKDRIPREIKEGITRAISK